MAASNDQSIETLNDLVRRMHDAREGYRTAAESTDTPDLKRHFFQRADERASFAGDLAEEVRRLGGEPAESGSAEANLHRAWLNLRGSVQGDAALLSEVERGEQDALEHYRGALERNLPGVAEETVRSQLQAIENARRQAAEMSG